MRRLTATLLVLLAACAPRETAAPRRSEERFDVALLTSGSIADEGWNAAAYEGLRRVQRELGAAAIHREVRRPASRHEEMRRLAAGGIDVVFAQGEEFQPAAVAAGRTFPRTVFVVGSGTVMAPNLAPLTFRLEEAAWLLGMAAASLSERGSGGVVGTLPSRSDAPAVAAFLGGARSVRPGFAIRTIYTGDPESSAASHRAATDLIDGGADVLLQIAGDAGRGVIAACTERGVLCFAAPRNVNDRAPGSIVASAVVDASTAMTEIAALARSDRFTPRPFSYGMKEGIVTIVWNQELRTRIPPDAVKRIDETEAAILAGRFVIRGK